MGKWKEELAEITVTEAVVYLAVLAVVVAIVNMAFPGFVDELVGAGEALGQLVGTLFRAVKDALVGAA